MKVKPLKVIKYLIPILFLALLGIFLAKWSDVKRLTLGQTNLRNLKKPLSRK